MESTDMQLELDDIQNVIKFTKVNIDTLNQRFCKIKPGMRGFLFLEKLWSQIFIFFSAPKIYLEEYDDLTSKLHHLETLERNLMLKIESFQADVRKFKIF